MTRFRIKQYAQGQGLRLGELARKLRMPLSNLSAIASGRRSVSVQLLSRIAGLLNCGVSELFEEVGVDPVFKDKRMTQALRELENANPLGIDKGWTHRLTFAQQKHFKGIRDGGVPYGAAGKKSADPWAALFDGFNKAGVDYVVIGMSGINYYARSAMETFGTQDYDLFLRPVVANAAKALEVLRDLGYEMVSGGKRVLEKDLSRIVKEKQTVLAVNPEGVTFELLFAISGFVFHQLAADAAIFRTGETLIRVGRLQKLLASKKAADRPKDRLFLKRYEMILHKAQENPKS